MKTALYIGNHSQDTLSVRLGWAATRLVQRGAYKRVTHCEMILDELTDGSVVLASASLRENGVRQKISRLSNGNWLIAEVPNWSLHQSRAWYAAHIGEPYDLRGALATVLPGNHKSDGWFCNEACAASVGFKEPHIFGPAQYGTIAMSLGTDITTDFFRSRA